MDWTLAGKAVVITGASGGIGRASAMALAREGAHLTLMCRNAGKAALVCDEIEQAGCARPSFIQLDMASLDSVRRAASEYLQRDQALQVLLNNAGVVNTERRVSEDGFEETLAVNHLAPFLLTGLLLPALEAATPARIVNVASDGYKFVRDMGFDDLQAQRRYRTFKVYGRSKLANILFTHELSRRLSERGITVNTLHPGAVTTGLGQQNGGWLSTLAPLLLKPFFRSPEQGARTSVHLCVSNDVNNISGRYFVNCQERAVKPWARDDTAAEKLWQLSEQLTGITYPT